MAYDLYLADRIKRILQEKHIHFEEKKMMGGLCFMVDDKMCLGVEKNNLMARIGEENRDLAFSKLGCREMNFTGRPMKNFVFVSPDAIDMDEELDFWVSLCLQYNPFAKSSKKKKK